MTAARLALPIDRLWPNAENRALRAVLLLALGTAALTVSAKIQVPFYPVPMTLQTFVVLLLGFAYGARLGAATVLTYLAQGALGLPVFASGGGLAYFTGPTAGYFLGWLLAVVAIGALARRTRALPALFAIALAGVALNYLPGVAWLAVLFDWPTALSAGALPFILGDLLKAGLAACLAYGLGRGLTAQHL